MNQFWLGLLGGFLGAALGVLGSEFVKFFLEPGRCLEAFRNNILEEMLAEIGKIEKIGAAYWNGEYPSKSPEIWAVEQDIKAGLHGLVRNAVDLFDGHQHARSTCEGKIRALRILVTGGSFGDGQQINDPQIALEIKTTTLDLKRILRNNRQKLKRRFL